VDIKKLEWGDYILCHNPMLDFVMLLMVCSVDFEEEEVTATPVCEIYHNWNGYTFYDIPTDNLCITKENILAEVENEGYSFENLKEDFPELFTDDPRNYEGVQDDN